MRKFDTHGGPFCMEGQVAIITGGSGLLGYQHARALAQLGARAIIADIDIAKAEYKVSKVAQEFGKSAAYALEFDVTSHDSVRKGLDHIVEKFGSVDVLVNNAAVDPKVEKNAVTGSSRLENFPLEQWTHQLNVGLTGAFICSKIIGAFLADNGGGVILNISSDLSVFAPDQRLYRSEDDASDQYEVKPVTYSVIKTGLIGLTRYLATYWNDRGVRVNALSPGGVFVGQGSDFVTKLESLIPLGRMAKEDEYISVVQFLCSGASSYMTGQNIVMDGGRSIW
jgi:NAD(P)-dependent dehydrogenase (short-subunit alcohol dehydrogenase family)